MQALSKDYRYAQTSGFVGSQEEYVKLRYEYYRATMKRNNIEPKNWVKWFLTLK